MSTRKKESRPREFLNYVRHSIFPLIIPTFRFILLFGFFSAVIISALYVAVQGLSFLIRIQLVEPPLLITLWVAEVPIAVFLRYVLGEYRANRASLIVLGEFSQEKGNMRYHGVNIRNLGHMGAERVEARLHMILKPEYILPDHDAEITPSNLVAESESLLWWRDAEDNEVSIKVGADSRLDIVRVVKEPNGCHFEIPSSKGWTRIQAALAPRSYEATMRILSMNSGVMRKSVLMVYNGKDDLSLTVLSLLS
jgi:hypothetical protein